MESPVRLSIVLTFDKSSDRLISELAHQTSEGLPAQYVTGVDSIPHCTLVQGHFDVVDEEALTTLVADMQNRLSETAVPELVDIALTGKSLDVNHNLERTYVGLNVHHVTKLQQCHNIAARVVRDCCGTVVSDSGIKYHPHITLAYLEPIQHANEVEADLARIDNEVILTRVAIGLNGDGGRLLEVLGDVVKKSPPVQTPKRRRFPMR